MMRACATTLESELSEKELACLTGHLKSDKQLTGKHLEIGTAAGGTLWRMMDCYDANSRPPFVVVDPMTYFENQLELVKKNLSDHGIDPESVEFRTGKSRDIFQAAGKADEEFDFIFIDGNHKFRYVTQDLCWARQLRPGGILCLHDYEPGFPGVMLATDRFLQANPNYEVIDHIERLIVLHKTRPSTRPEVSQLDLIYSQIRTPLMQLRKSIKKRLG